LNKQIATYRKMTGEQRLAVALELHQLACDVAREGIRRTNPGADAGGVELLLKRSSRAESHKMNERELLLDCLRRLNRSRVVYFLTRSMASNYWGIPRTTHDLDFVVQLSSPATTRIIQEFTGDFYIDEEAVQAARQPPYQFNAVDTRSALKVDFWLARVEPFDQEMLRRRIQVTLFGESAAIATAEDVILHKLVWNRISPSERQLGDAAGVVAVQADALDKNYLRRWAQELNLTAEIESLLGGQILPKNT
jgi:hypothetical protein